MLERFNPVLRIICLALAGLVLYQFSRLALRKDPLQDVRVLALSTNGVRPSSGAAGRETGKASRNPGTFELSHSAAPEDGRAPGSPLSGGALPRNLGGPRGGPGLQGPDLPPAVQTRVDRITQSEILGPVIRPLPMALLGIAGRDAFLRAPDGQTGLLREGEELGGVKLLRIGTNRVVIEHEQQQKELTVFSGLGSDTLLPKGKANPP